MGYGYLRRGDYQNAYGAYEAAAEKFSGTIFSDSDTVKHCKDNMAKIERKQENPDAVIDFYTPSLDREITLSSSPPFKHLQANRPFAILS